MIDDLVRLYLVRTARATPHPPHAAAGSTSPPLFEGGGTPKEGHMQIKLFGREPAVWLYVINAIVAFLATIPAVGLTAESSGWVMTIANGVIALLVALATRPFVVSALTGALSTILTGLASFGLPFTEQQTGAFVIVVSAVLGLVLRSNVSPAPPARPSGLGVHAGRDLADL